jgi:hypothetical protein
MKIIELGKSSMTDRISQEIYDIDKALAEKTYK